MGSLTIEMLSERAGIIPITTTSGNGCSSCCLRGAAMREPLEQECIHDVHLTYIEYTIGIHRYTRVRCSGTPDIQKPGATRQSHQASLYANPVLEGLAQEGSGSWVQRQGQTR